MQNRILFLAFALILCTGKLYSQVSGTITVNGDLDKFYPVSFSDGGNNSNAAVELQIGRSSVHRDSLWRGSVIAKFRFHTYNWGNASNFIDADIRQANINNPTYNKLIAGWTDVTGTNNDARILIWMRGNTTYSYNSNYAVSPAVYDGVQNALPYQQTNGPTFTYKTVVDPYVNIAGMSYNHSAYFNGGGNNYFAGNVGIGTDTPLAKLHITAAQGAVLGKFTQSNVPDADGYLNIINATGATGSFIPSIVGRTKAPGRVLGLYLTGEAEDVAPTPTDINLAAVVLDGRSKTGSKLVNNNVLSVCSYGQNLMMVKADGSVGINATDTKGYKLAVGGSMIAEKIKVKLQGAWPDYVFADDYKLPSLAEVAAYVKEHRHLPDMPAAEEVEKEGLDVAEMNKQLLKKVEELTLYIIQQQQETSRQITQLKEELAGMKEK